MFQRCLSKRLYNKGHEETSPRVLDPLAARSAGVAHLALALRELVLSEVNVAVERVYNNHPSAIWFGFAKTGEEPKMKDMVLYVAAASSHVNLGFCRGASLLDPNRVGRRRKENASHQVQERTRFGAPIRAALHSRGFRARTKDLTSPRHMPLSMRYERRVRR